ncbi:MAG: cation-transporting P-type ATPase [Sumerlaeia bacterium]
MTSPKPAAREKQQAATNPETQVRREDKRVEQGPDKPRERTDDNPAYVDNPWARGVEDICQELAVDPQRGLSDSDVEERLDKYGENQLRTTKPPSAWKIFISQFKGMVVWLLIVAMGVTLFMQDWLESGAIAIVLLVNAIIGFLTEWKAMKSMEALKKLGGSKARVRRNGQAQEVEARQLVPGDIVILDGGDVVSADLRLIEINRLQIEEAALTGESVPVDKKLAPVEADIELAERKNMAYKGTAARRGTGEGVVVGTGMHTELGNISSMVEEAESEQAPIQKRLDDFGKKLVWITIGISVVVGVAGLVAGRELALMVKTGVALAVAVIPEGLPIVATIALARGMYRMAKRNALVRRLPAVETLGSTTVICTDKTGTLTENRMTAKALMLASGAHFEISGQGYDTEGGFRRDNDNVEIKDGTPLHEFLVVGALCNNASMAGEKPKDRRKDEASGGEVAEPSGDPTEIALLYAAAKAGLKREALVKERPEEREEPFDSDTALMGTFHKDSDGYFVAVKGAPESVLDISTRKRTEDGGEAELSDAERQEWNDKNKELAKGGLRVLALASKRVAAVEEEPYKDLTFLGLVGLLDPPRSDVKAAIETCRGAGIQVVMVTGDQPATARQIAAECGLFTEGEDQDSEVLVGRDLQDFDDMTDEEVSRLVHARVLARVSPKQKLELITAHQENGDIVAMTGDGVNDAPALKKADIGVAMGQRGTQVAREASDIVLQDDSFTTIAEAVREGRVIFNNIRNFVIFLLSVNSSAVITVLAAAVVGPGGGGEGTGAEASGGEAAGDLLITPLQILYLNFVTNVFPALALGVSEGDPDIMKRPARNPKAPIINNADWIGLAVYGSVISAVTLTAYFASGALFDISHSQRSAIAFLTLALSQLLHVFSMRPAGSPLIKNEVTQNPWVWGSVGICASLLLLAVYMPGLNTVLNTSEGVPLAGWGMVVGLALIPMILGQIWKQTPMAKRLREKRVEQHTEG